MKFASFLVLAKLLVTLVSITLLIPYANANIVSATSLKIGFYNTTCPSAETVVRSFVDSAVRANPGIAAGLIRMHFHDCFVRGCDASVLLDSTASSRAEKDAPPNNPSLRGFEVIDNAKAQLEVSCPNTVSCADILAFAARDSASIVGNIDYCVPSGRRDGMVSIEQEALDNLPPPSANFTELVERFANKSLSQNEMITLSGAHSIGVSHCSSFSDRLFNFSSSSQFDPTLDSAYVAQLQIKCPFSSSADPTVSMDSITPDLLDNNYYVGLTKNLGLFTSDQALLTNEDSLKTVRSNIKDGSKWGEKFGKAMVKMGKIDVLTGKSGEIRKNCHFVNTKINMRFGDDNHDQYYYSST